MKYKTLLLSFIWVFVTPSVFGQKTSLRDSAMAFFRAKPLNYTSLEWQTRVDSALKIDPKHDKLWQEKAMPFLKNGDFGSWLKYIGKSVELKPTEWLPYRAFCREIFMKDYEAAIKDFEAAEKMKSDEILFEMDHSYDFYKALAYLELKKPELALKHIQKSVDWQMKNKGLDWTHYADFFYLAMTHLDLNHTDLALENLNICLDKYAQFPSALYYKALILKQLGKKNEAMPYAKNALKYLEKGYYMNEDNEAYSNYPRQISVYEIEKLLNEL